MLLLLNCDGWIDKTHLTIVEIFVKSTKRKGSTITGNPATSLVCKLFKNVFGWHNLKFLLNPTVSEVSKRSKALPDKQ